MILCTIIFTIVLALVLTGIELSNEQPGIIISPSQRDGGGGEVFKYDIWPGYGPLL